MPKFDFGIIQQGGKQLLKIQLSRINYDMTKPKTVKGWLNMMLAIADTYTMDLKGSENLTEVEYTSISALTAQIQNNLGEDLKDVLERYNLKWDG